MLAGQKIIVTIEEVTPHNMKLHLICGLSVAALVAAVIAEIFDAKDLMHLELYFSIGMAFTLVLAFAISVWTFLDWREEQKKNG